jgi:hypothetical protein
VEKLVEGVATFKIAEERLNRHPRADEDRRPTEDIRVAVDDLTEWRHRDCSVPQTISRFVLRAKTCPS